VEKVATYQSVREHLLKKAGVPSHFDFMKLDNEREEICRQLWDEINHEEFRKGYKKEEHERPGTPALWQMRLLTEKELLAWLEKIDKAF